MELEMMETLAAQPEAKHCAQPEVEHFGQSEHCLLYTSDAADE